MELDRKQTIRKVAAFIYATTVLNQGDNDYFISFDDIEKEMIENNDVELPKNWRNDTEFLQDIQDELSNYPGCEGNSDACWIQKNDCDEYGDECEREEKLTSDEEGFDLCLFTDYIAWNVNNY